jgi:hypothetical protein
MSGGAGLGGPNSVLSVRNRQGFGPPGLRQWPSFMTSAARFALIKNALMSLLAAHCEWVKVTDPRLSARARPRYTAAGGFSVAVRARRSE